MILRFGTYTRYKGFDFRLLKETDRFKLIFNGVRCPLPNFEEYTAGVFYLDVPETAITNAFFVKTICIYKGYEFDVSTITGDGNVGITTDDKVVSEKLNLECRDRGVYQTEINVKKIEKLWEERTTTSLGLPMPEEIKEFEEIDVLKI